MRLHLLLSILLTIVPYSLAKVKNKINLQWSICDTNPQTVLRKLGEESRHPDKLDPISYYDTNPPTYTPSGLMFRTKVRAGKEISVVKIGFAKEIIDVPTEAKATCLWDRYGDDISFVCSKQSNVKRSRTWSKKQVLLVDSFQRVKWDELVKFGPYMNPKWKQLSIEGYKAVFDSVVAPSSHLMELEVKVSPDQGSVAYQIITDHLKKCGVVLCGHQMSKTMRLFQEMGFRLTNESEPIFFPGAQRPLYNYD